MVDVTMEWPEQAGVFVKKGLPCTLTVRNAQVGIGEKPALCVTPATTMEFVVMEPRGTVVVIVMKDLTGKYGARTV